MTPAAESYAVLAASCGDVALIHSHPEFAITATGEVYRLAGACRPDNYPLKMCPCRWSRDPAVALDGRRRTIASLMREHFPDQPQTKEA